MTTRKQRFIDPNNPPKRHRLAELLATSVQPFIESQMEPERYDAMVLDFAAAKHAGRPLRLDDPIFINGRTGRMVDGNTRARALADAGYELVMDFNVKIVDVPPADEEQYAWDRSEGRRQLSGVPYARDIARFMRKHSLTQQEMADRMGCSQSKVSRLLKLLPEEERPDAHPGGRPGVSEAEESVPEPDRQPPSRPEPGGPGWKNRSAFGDVNDFRLKLAAKVWQGDWHRQVGSSHEGDLATVAESLNELIDQLSLMRTEAREKAAVLMSQHRLRENGVTLADDQPDRDDETFRGVVETVVGLWRPQSVGHRDDNAEWDWVPQVGDKNLRRLTSGRYFVKDGEPVDVFAQRVIDAGLAVDVDSAMEWYCQTALAELDERIVARSGKVAWEQQEQPDDD